MRTTLSTYLHTKYEDNDPLSSSILKYGSKFKVPNFGKYDGTATHADLALHVSSPCSRTNLVEISQFLWEDAIGNFYSYRSSVIHKSFVQSNQFRMDIPIKLYIKHKHETSDHARNMTT